MSAFSFARLFANELFASAAKRVNSAAVQNVKHHFRSDRGLKTIGGTEISRNVFRTEKPFAVSALHNRLYSQKTDKLNQQDQHDKDPTAASHKPTDFEKMMLVKSKIYPNKESIPEFVKAVQVTTAKDWFRIRVSMWILIVTGLGLGSVVYSRAHARNSRLREQLEHQRSG